jgi:nucleotide-binding universal stress UspA family protein
VSNRSFVVVPVDGSRRDIRSTAEYAVGIARQRAADVRAVQVVPRVAGRSIEPDELGLRAALRALRRAAERDNVRVQHITLTGRPERVIPAYAQLTGAVMIVVGSSYGTSDLWRNTSVVRCLSRSSPVPVVVVPSRRPTSGAQVASLKRIVTAVDSTVASAVALRAAVELAQEHDARLTVVHSMRFPNTAFSAGEAWRSVQELTVETRALAMRLKKHAAALGSRDTDPFVVTGEPSAAITAAAAATAADLIVMGIAPRPWLDEVMFGSTFRAVLRKAKTPVMVLPVIAGAHEWNDLFVASADLPGHAAGAAAPFVYQGSLP